jgi:pyruvate dehydrogenase kinase 2/3/4
MFSIALRSHSKRCRLTRAVPLAARARHVTSSQQARRGFSTAPYRPVVVLDEWVAREARPISLRQLMVFGRSLTESRLISSANYVRTELPVRIAHRIRDMQQLPYVVVTNRHINEVYNMYYDVFDKLRKFKEIKTLEDNDELCQLIAGTLKAHLTVIPKLTIGILECGRLMNPKDMESFMNTMLKSRISRRVIAEQHLSLSETFNSPNFSPGAKLSESDFIGEVFIKCIAKDVIERCAQGVRALARSTNVLDKAIILLHLGVEMAYKCFLY